jgi:hypothetical protein
VGVCGHAHALAISLLRFFHDVATYVRQRLIVTFPMIRAKTVLITRRNNNAAEVKTERSRGAGVRVGVCAGSGADGRGGGGDGSGDKDATIVQFSGGIAGVFQVMHGARFTLWNTVDNNNPGFCGVGIERGCLKS